MKWLFIAALIASTISAPAFAKDAATMICKDYSALDNIGKMAVLAELQAMNE